MDKKTVIKRIIIFTVLLVQIVTAIAIYFVTKNPVSLGHLNLLTIVFFSLWFVVSISIKIAILIAGKIPFRYIIAVFLLWAISIFYAQFSYASFPELAQNQQFLYVIMFILMPFVDNFLDS